MAIIKKRDNTFWQRCGETENLIHCWWEYKNRAATVENSLTINLLTQQLYSSVPKETENTCPHKNLKIFIATLFIKAKKWKPHKCSSD